MPSQSDAPTGEVINLLILSVYFWEHKSYIKTNNFFLNKNPSKPTLLAKKKNFCVLKRTRRQVGDTDAR